MKDLFLHFDDDEYPESRRIPEDAFVHKISRHDAALLIGVSSIETLDKDYISGATENDVHSMQEIFIDQFGLKPSSVQALSALSHQKATTHNIKKALGGLSGSLKRGSALFVYISAPCWVKNGQCFIPTQEYNKKGAQEFGIYAQTFEKYLRNSEAEVIVLILDCNNAGEFARPLVESSKRYNKDLYMICSQQNFGRSLADEKILKHGYITFFLKFYFRRMKTRTLSIRDLTDFLKKYTTPLSKFAYHPVAKQGNQVPTLVHRGDKAGEVEHDGAPASTPPSSERWRKFLLQTQAYTTWLESKREDALVLLGDTQFAKTQLYLHVYLTCLKSFSLLLLERDKFYFSQITEDNLGRLADNIICVVGDWLNKLAHTDHDRWEKYEGLEDVDRSYVIKGLKEGSTVVQIEMERAINEAETKPVEEIN